MFRNNFVIILLSKYFLKIFMKIKLGILVCLNMNRFSIECGYLDNHIR